MASQTSPLASAAIALPKADDGPGWNSKGSVARMDWRRRGVSAMAASAAVVRREERDMFPPNVVARAMVAAARRRRLPLGLMAFRRHVIEPVTTDGPLPKPCRHPAGAGRAGIGRDRTGIRPGSVDQGESSGREKTPTADTDTADMPCAERHCSSCSGFTTKARA